MHRNCGLCHTCGEPLKLCLDGEEWCERCQAYRRYPSHGWSRGVFSDSDTRCPDPAERAGEKENTNGV